MTSLDSFQRLPREALFIIANHLPIDSIQKFALALLRRGEVSLLDDEYLFRQLAKRDFNQSTMPIKLEKDWTWKLIYRAILGLQRQMINEMEMHRGLKSPCCHGRRLLIPPVPLKLHFVVPTVGDDSDDDDDDIPHPFNVSLETSRSLSVTLNEERQLVFVPDEATVTVANRDFINVETQQFLQNRQVMMRFHSLDRANNRPLGEQLTAFVQEGLCAWVYGTKTKHCKYKLLYPMEKIRVLFGAAKHYVEQQVVERESVVNRILAEKLVLRYRIDKAELVGQYADIIWPQLKRIFTRAELAEPTIGVSLCGTVLTFTCGRDIRWTYNRLCLAEACMERIPRRALRAAYDPNDHQQTLRRYLCFHHYNEMKHYVRVVDLEAEKQHYLKIERLNFIKRDFRDKDFHLNLPEKFSVEISHDTRIDFQRLSTEILKA